ncbi:MAG: Hsp70 family protein, partial [Planctomycetaceae bacterium]
MSPIHAVGIDLGTTYSCLAYLNEHGEPITVPNRDGELSTPSAVLFDGKQVIVGTEALNHAILYPERVVMHAKRHMGSPDHRWQIQGKSYSPVDVSTLILRSLLNDARERLGDIERAVITVPAQFSDVQRQATAEAGKRAGLKQVDIINEPVSAALCFVLGTEGAWFVELATDQRILVVDLGGGTYDLTIVQYKKNQITVQASGGDLHLGGIDWNQYLEKAIARQFQKEFQIDPAADRTSLQALAQQVEQAKRSLSVRPRAALTCQAGGRMKSYQVELAQFERLTKPLVDRMEQLTLQLLADQKLGWAKIDVVLTTGGASRMPMVRTMLKRLSGRTLNTSLSPDQSIAHGAAYYAGMLIEKSTGLKSHLKPTAASRLQQFRHRSANARALGILVRNMETQAREPHYLLAPNSELPASVTQQFGTVVEEQKRVHLRVIESGTAADAQY